MREAKSSIQKAAGNQQQAADTFIISRLAFRIYHFALENDAKQALHQIDKCQICNER